jgi:hypothetical protein
MIDLEGERNKYVQKIGNGFVKLQEALTVGGTTECKLNRRNPFKHDEVQEIS